jgi:NAD(P)H dehydrogenase (quinone)
VICPAGHPVDHLEKTGIADSMRRVMLNDRLLGVGVKEAQMEILGGMMHNDPDIRKQNLETSYRLGCNF